MTNPDACLDIRLLLGLRHALMLLGRHQSGADRHALRVAQLALSLGCALDLSDPTLTRLYLGALLHDIGKLSLPRWLLHKTGPLTAQERLALQGHPIAGKAWLSGSGDWRLDTDIPYLHHEHWDGSGYPLGLRGKDIPLLPRIVAVADVWDALLEERPYRPAWSETQAKNHLEEQAGVSLDPLLVGLFTRFVL